MVVWKCVAPTGNNIPAGIANLVPNNDGTNTYSIQPADLTPQDPNNPLCGGGQAAPSPVTAQGTFASPAGMHCLSLAQQNTTAKHVCVPINAQRSGYMPHVSSGCVFGFIVTPVIF